ncbi:hypothetical protein, partial [Tenacibaculum discolor]|uniref:hypothetical protein n=1 Tax=Tenacibaculum discolor TaxID=361581 RepID=UPI001F3D2AC3
RVLYHRILDAASEPCIEHKRTIVNNDGYVTARSGKGRNVAEAREFVEQLLKQRKVKALIIDECLH